MQKPPHSRSKHARREVLKIAALATTASPTLHGCHTAISQSLALRAACHVPTREQEQVLHLPYEKQDFPLGVMSGDVTHDSVLCWTKYSRREPLKLLLLPVEPRSLDTPAVIERDVALDENGFAHVLVEGLQSHSAYRYVFVRMRDGVRVARGPMGHCKTAHDPNSLEPVIFGGTSCTSAQIGGDFPTMRRAALCGELDFFVHSGDHVYADEAITLEQYRAVYERTFARSGLRALHESVAMFVSWDDHEVVNNWDGETVDPERMRAARQAFIEHHAWRGGVAAPRRLYEKFSWGKSLDLFMLDTRGERRLSTRQTPQAQYVSEEQLHWLIDGVRNSQAVFKCIVNPVPITHFGGLFSLAEFDRWEGYAAQRERLLNALVNERNLWWLSGDFHLGSVGKVEATGPRAKMREVLMGPGGQIPNPIASVMDPPQFEFATSDCNWVRFAADPQRQTMEVTFINDVGRTLFSRVYPAQERA